MTPSSDDRTTNRFVLKFPTTLGNLVRFSIPRARVDKTPQEILSSMNALLANGGFTFPGRGNPSGIYGASLVEAEHRRIV